MNAQVSTLDAARTAETENLPPITERPTRPAGSMPAGGHAAGGTQVRKKKRGRILLLMLAVISVALAGYTMVKGRLAQGSFGFRTEQAVAPKPDPIKLLQDRVAELETALKASDGNSSQLQKSIAGDIESLRGMIGTLPTAEEIASVRAQLDQLKYGVDRHTTRLGTLEGADQARRTAQAERVQQQQETRVREEAETLPFRVLALDRWGGKPYLTVAPPGVNVLETMAVGDKRAGWELKEVDARGGNVTFVDQNGHSITKTVEER